MPTHEYVNEFILLQFYQLARKEIAALIVADEHPNVVRCFAMEECSEFVYLALERCKLSLNDMLGDVTPERAREFRGTDGQPSDMCLKVSLQPLRLPYPRAGSVLCPFQISERCTPC